MSALWRVVGVAGTSALVVSHCCEHETIMTASRAFEFREWFKEFLSMINILHHGRAEKHTLPETAYPMHLTNNRRYLLRERLNSHYDPPYLVSSESFILPMSAINP